MKEQAIQNGPTPVASCWVHHHASSFIKDQNRVVCKDAIQRNVLGQKGMLLWHLLGKYPNLLPATQDLSRLHDLAIDQYGTLARPRLQAIARIVT